MNRSDARSRSRKVPAQPTRAQRRALDALVAARYLSRTDPRLKALIKRIGPYRPIMTHNPFVCLVGAIVHQQLSMSAATTIQWRLKARCPRGRVTPDAILALTDGELRAAGLSNQKVRYVRDVAEHFASGQLSARKLRRMSDETVIEAVTQIKGVGRWTAEMLLMFCLERPDIWPTDDLGLRKAVQKFLNERELPKPSVIGGVADRWRPYRTYATWYLWRSLEGPLMPGIMVPPATGGMKAGDPASLRSEL